MANSIFLARLIGPLMLAVGIGIFVNGAVYRLLADEFLRSRALIYLSGLLIMTAGLAIVLTHNVWRADWPVLITILGWLADDRRRRPHHRAAGHRARRPRASLKQQARPHHRRRRLARGRRDPLCLRLRLRPLT